MAEDGWYRSTSWDARIEADFHDQLGRARNKAQYLRIQAHYIAESHPKAALSLLSQYFALGENFDLAQALVDRARAEVVIGDLAGAAASYEAALRRESTYPSVKTQAFLDYACLVAEKDIRSLFGRALEVLETHKDRAVFPLERYRAEGARALLFQLQGRTQEAREAATRSIRAAQESRSGFRNHPTLGLVDKENSPFLEKITALAG